MCIRPVVGCGSALFADLMPNLVGIASPGDSDELRKQSLARMQRAVDLPAFGFQARSVSGEWAACANILPGHEDNLLSLIHI